MRRELLTIALALDDDLVGGVGQAVQGAVAQDRVVKQCQPLLNCSVGSDRKARCPVPGNDQFVQVVNGYSDAVADAESVREITPIGVK